MEINIYEAKTNFSKLIQLLVDKKETEITVCKNGTPLITMTLAKKLTSKRIGVAKEEMKGFDLSLEVFDSIPVNEFFED